MQPLLRDIIVASGHRAAHPEDNLLPWAQGLLPPPPGLRQYPTAPATGRGRSSTPRTGRICTIRDLGAQPRPRTRATFAAGRAGGRGSGSKVTSIERPTTLTGLVVERLRADILSGELKPGEHLRQNEVASAYGVSSTPVREAFVLLERDGLVVVQPHRGVTVVEPTMSDLREIYEIRKQLECLAIELACQNPDRDLGPAQAALEELEAVEHSDPVGYKLNRIFHEEMYALAKRPRLERLIADQRDACAVYVTLLSHFVGGGPGTADEDHRRIIAALGAGDAAEASAAMAAHLDNTVRAVERMFEQRQASQTDT